MRKRLLRGGFVGLVGLSLAIQLVPYGHAHSNPPVRREPAWDSPQTRELAARACYGCHSNQTDWPWYSHVAPLSWLFQRDVEVGRRALNFSEWGRRQPAAADSDEAVERHRMPPLHYILLSPDARLSAGEREWLVRGLAATFEDKQ